MNNRRRLITLIHIAKSQLGLDEETYRETLVDITKKDSSKNMTVPEMERVMEHFKKCGFKPTQNRKASPKSRNKEKPQPVDKVRALWIGLYKDGYIKDGSEKALGSWVERMTKKSNGIGYQSIDFVPTSEVASLIESLKRWKLREEKKHENV